ncbi:hypothetical protein CEXT_261681 [Caerostris extrusa]|uniref:Uncharacterized protein n=1 Tax=Caerostris extrusa TaxID=172846 RepID=A0AAV4RSE0_CAEEX|nr:hypothetical protein CEXT_261681 [Caerostris extrusa]
MGNSWFTDRGFRFGYFSVEFCQMAQVVEPAANSLSRWLTLDLLNSLLGTITSLFPCIFDKQKWLLWSRECSYWKAIFRARLKIPHGLFGPRWPEAQPCPTSSNKPLWANQTMQIAETD